MVLSHRSAIQEHFDQGLAEVSVIRSSGNPDEILSKAREKSCKGP